MKKGVVGAKMRDLVNILENFPGHILNDETWGVGGSAYGYASVP